MPLKVRRSDRAKADELELWLYLGVESERAADKVLDRIDGVVRMLAECPDADAIDLHLLPA